MNGDHRTDRPRIGHDLGVAFRFVDMFTSRAINTPLDVRAEALPAPPPPPPPPQLPPRRPDLPWRAIRRTHDATYRFVASRPAAIPNGALPILVDAPNGEYINFEPLSVVLPRPHAAHPPTPDRSDYLIERVLWPTRRARLEAGETAIIGRVLSGGVNAIARLRVRFAPGIVPPAPYTYTDERGEFVFRFPALKRQVIGAIVTSTASLNIEMHAPPAYAALVVPVAPAFPLVLTLGQVAVVEIQVP
jgi:hypothetical protein